MSAARLEKGEVEGRFRLIGELGFETVPALWRQGGELFHGCPELCIDLREVQRSDSAGLALLIDWARQSRAAQQPIRFINMPDQMLDIVRVSGLDKVLALFRADAGA